MLAHTPGVEDLSLTTNGDPARQARGAAGRRRPAPHQRLARLAVAHRVSPRSRGATRSTVCSPVSKKPSATRSCARSRSTASPSAASPRRRCPRLAELARRKPYVIRFIEFMPLDADEAWRADEVLTGGGDSRADRGALAARRDPGEAVLDRAPLPLRRRPRRDRVRQPRLGAVLLLVRPHPPHGGRPAAHVPVLAPRVGSEGAAQARILRRRARDVSYAGPCSTRSSSTGSTKPDSSAPRGR